MVPVIRVHLSLVSVVIRTGPVGEAAGAGAAAASLLRLLAGGHGVLVREPFRAVAAGRPRSVRVLVRAGVGGGGRVAERRSIVPRLGRRATGRLGPPVAPVVLLRRRLGAVRVVRGLRRGRGRRGGLVPSRRARQRLRPTAPPPRTDPRRREVPFLFLSSASARADRRGAARAGDDARTRGDARDRGRERRRRQRHVPPPLASPPREV